jgi:GNAT superfamily N-acetyltransferase
MARNLSSYVLRPARPADVEEIRKCVDEAYGPYVERIGAKPGPMLDDYGAVVKERQVTVSDYFGVIAGVLVLAITEEGFLLENVAVLPSHRGMGRLLLQRAEDEARRQGYDSIYLYTHEKMTENQALYKKIGYTEYDRRTEHGLARVFMRKAL